MSTDLERLYQDAKSALASRDLDRASSLLRQILVIDENYKDASRLLAQTVKLRRRRWYNHPLLWGILGLGILLVLGIYILQRTQGSYAVTPNIHATSSPETMSTPSKTQTPTAPSTLTPTPIPLVWKRLSLGQEFARDEIISIAQDPNDKEVIYIRTSQAGIYITINGGASWQPADQVMPASENNPRNSGLRLPGECTVLAINPNNNAIAYCGIEKGIYRTIDTGKNWELSNPKVGWVKTILISPHDPQVIFSGGQGFSISRDGGQTWETSNNGLPNVPLELKIDPQNPSVLFTQDVADFAKPIFRSTNSGLAWLPFYTGSCVLIFDSDGNPLCFSYSANRRSLDEGKSWVGINISRKTNIYAANPLRSRTMLASSNENDGTLYVSQDNGNTWENAYLHHDSKGSWDLRFYFDHNQGQVIYAAEETINRSTDGGKTWKACGGPPGLISRTETRLAIDYRNSDHIILASQGQGVLVSKDGCASWRESNTGLGNTYANTVAADPNNPDTFYAGTDGGAYVSFDSGQTWSQINDGLLGATVVYSIVVDKDSNVYAATPYGIFKLEAK